jgi:hypothetical protein
VATPQLITVGFFIISARFEKGHKKETMYQEAKNRKKFTNLSQGRKKESKQSIIRFTFENRN